MKTEHFQRLQTIVDRIIKGESPLKLYLDNDDLIINGVRFEKELFTGDQYSIVKKDADKLADESTDKNVERALKELEAIQKKVSDLQVPRQ